MLFIASKNILTQAQENLLLEPKVNRGSITDPTWIFYLVDIGDVRGCEMLPLGFHPSCTSP